MSEFVFEDGRKAEKIENNLDPMTKVIEVYVEPKPEKKLAQRITEKFCVCEREIETIDELTGEVVSRSVEKVCDGDGHRQDSSFNVFKAVEKKVSDKRRMTNYIFAAVVVVQLGILLYVLFGM